MSLEISQAIVDAILEQSRAEYPDECCGAVLGPAGSGKALRLKPMVNSAHSPTFYEFDPKDLLALYREVDDSDEEIVVIYHSHTETEAYPSRTDIAYAGEPGAHYAVSYTHLRAHETGRNLVCRLHVARVVTRNAFKCTY